MKILPLIAATAALSLAACQDKSGNDAATAANGAMPEVTAAPVAAPNNGDWSEVVATTPEGGFVMGNPNAKVKLVEFGSMTCPHCREFDEQGVPALIDNYVKKGLVAFEFRNFVRDPVDMTASLVARCGGTSNFFGMTRSLYASQPEWFGQVQAAGAPALDAIQARPAQQQFQAFADLAGFPAFAAMRGLPRNKTAACLADPAAASKLVQINSDAVSQYQIPGTPAFVINGELVDDAAAWSALEPAIRRALAG